MNRLLRKIKLAASLLITRKVVLTRHPDGSVKTVVRFRGDERFMKEISRVNHPPKKNPNQ